VINFQSGAVPKETYNPFQVEVEAENVAEDKKESIKPISIETQTPVSILSNASATSGTSQEDVKASIQKSIITVGKMNEIVKNSVASAQQSLKSMETPIQVIPPAKVVTMSPSAPVAQPTAPEVNAQRLQHFLKAEAASRQILVPAPSIPAPSAPTPAIRQPTTSNIPLAPTSANLMANRSSQPPKWTPSKVGPAVIVYDPNPKINAAVHTMINMGFSNEGK
jgi:hypothetical protein